MPTSKQKYALFTLVTSFIIIGFILNLNKAIFFAQDKGIDDFEHKALYFSAWLGVIGAVVKLFEDEYYEREYGDQTVPDRRAIYHNNSIMTTSTSMASTRAKTNIPMAA